MNHQRMGFTSGVDAPFAARRWPSRPYVACCPQAQLWIELSMRIISSQTPACYMFQDMVVRGKIRAQMLVKR